MTPQIDTPPIVVNAPHIKIGASDRESKNLVIGPVVDQRIPPAMTPLASTPAFKM